ncbi:hypothetical protein CMESO_330 (nucleomorph) [Chroomonas mesostigmatica CCMP1168]|uniref:Uncharacterized protein n=1 Tax=Chroomonas mesostigmatica CCMP1168 TaxID=1195612 RepID=J7G1Z2_9CRYP|nr:hypothetical protein CMESO_330 [Chroomonas mesostigmatica CCMP1168]
MKSEKKYAKRYLIFFKFYSSLFLKENKNLKTDKCLCKVFDSTSFFFYKNLLYKMDLIDIRFFLRIKKQDFKKKRLNLTNKNYKNIKKNFYSINKIKTRKICFKFQKFRKFFPHFYSWKAKVCWKKSLFFLSFQRKIKKNIFIRKKFKKRNSKNFKFSYKIILSLTTTSKIFQIYFFLIFPLFFLKMRYFSWKIFFFKKKKKIDKKLHVHYCLF